MTSQSQPVHDDSMVGAACIPNISRAERLKRLRFGIVGLVVALGALALMLAFQVDVWWRLALYPLFAGAASGYFQWRDKT